MDLFELDDTASVTDLLTGQLEKAVQASETNIANSVTKINLLQDLVNAADTNGFEGVFQKYLSIHFQELTLLNL